MEPLSEHLSDYNAHMTQNYGSGVQACYRGPRLYDTEQTKEAVSRQIAHYKKYRDILNADVIHLKRPTGRDWDGILHVDPKLPIKGYAMLYNPLDESITRNIKLPLYYTGLENEAKVQLKGKPVSNYELERDFSINLEITIEAKSSTWIIIE